MDDVDAVQAQIARNMLASGDFVTARLNGVAYLEKPPLVYWLMAGSYRVFGVHDWSARLPLAIGTVLLCLLVCAFARWAFDDRSALYSGLAISTCIGLFLFTRILIPDALLTLSITAAVWMWLRLLDPDEQPTLLTSAALGAALGCGLLLKGLIAIVFPIVACCAYMAITRHLFALRAWKRLRPTLVLAVTLAIAVPWHVLATLRNRPLFAFSMHSGPGEYRGFFWFYFFNEHLLRFLNLRYPRDYNTVPPALFWLLNLVWLFPWSAYLLGLRRSSFTRGTRAGRVRIMAVCWIATVMLFFTLSTTQEYYSMPIYPALALLIGSALASGNSGVRRATTALQWIFGAVGVSLVVLLALVWRIRPVGDIAQALTQNPEMYTLSLGHFGDLTLKAFAYLKLPLAIASLAFLAAAGAITALKKRAVDTRAIAASIAFGMVIFFQAARLALVRFENYLGSYPLAKALQQAPAGQLIEADAYYAFSSVFFYTNRTALLLNGRSNNLEYGSYAPGAPNVFIDDHRFAELWSQRSRWYLLAYGSDLPHLREVVGDTRLHVVAENSGNYLLSNLPVQTP